MHFTELEIHEQTAGIARVAIAGDAQARARRQAEAIDLQDVRRWREAAVTVLTFAVGDEGCAFFEAETNSWNAELLLVLQMVRVDIREDRADHARVWREHAARDDDGCAGHIRFHRCCAHRRRGRRVDAGALERARTDADAVGERDLIALRLRGNRERKSGPGRTGRIRHRLRRRITNGNVRRTRKVAESQRQLVRHRGEGQCRSAKVRYPNRIRQGIAHLDHACVHDFLHRQSRFGQQSRGRRLRHIIGLWRLSAFTHVGRFVR